jgi:hypothetical protein
VFSLFNFVIAEITTLIFLLTHSHLQVEIESSFEAIKDIQLIARAALLKNSENVAVLDSKVLTFASFFVI